MAAALFDPARPSFRQSPDADDHFLRARAAEDIIDLLGAPPARCALIGADDPALARWFGAHGIDPIAMEPGPLLVGDPETILADPDYRDNVAAFDVVVTLGVIEKCNDPGLAVAVLSGLLAPGGRLVGVAVGGSSLSTLRRALLTVDRAVGRAAIRIHRMIDGSGLAGLMASAGLNDPVVSVDRVDVRYTRPERLVDDLRRMGCGRRLLAPSPPFSREQWQAVREDLSPSFTERFDLLHFHAIKPNA